MLAKKRFGQNFLHDPAMINKIVASIAPKSQDVLIEIGPGQGAMTHPLLKSGCVIHAIEIDQDLIIKLQPLTHSRFILHHADALKVNFSDIAPKFRLVGNLPYNISTPLLFHLMHYLHHIEDLHVMLQREVVDRIVAEPNNKIYGRLSVMLQYYCDVERLFLIPPGVFYPAPKVESAFLRLIPKKIRCLTEQQEEKLEELVRLAFSQRRKTLRNNLKKIMTEEIWKTVDIDPQQRPENLTVHDFILLVGKIWPPMQ